MPLHRYIFYNLSQLCITALSLSYAMCNVGNYFRILEIKMKIKNDKKKKQQKKQQ
jgi:hypothetical protein